ncbi:MAG: type III pantothenate kinase [Lentisphaerae bacterium]|nr:type III pantothenate kinase [Lentisphaerota bacterium]
MQILLNIGNTHSQIAKMTANGVPELLAQLDSPALLAAQGAVELLDALPAGWQGLAVSVVPALTGLLHNRYGDALRFLGPADFPQLDFQRVDTSTLGMDRIANAAAAHALAGRAVVVVDCGTAITLEAVDADGRFMGGAILPGRLLMRRSLAAYTAQLPLLSLQQQRPAALGRCTREAMTAGMDLGAVGAVTYLLEQCRLEMGAADILCWAVGGDAAFFCDNVPELIPGPEYLTLRGVACSRHGAG